MTALSTDLEALKEFGARGARAVLITWRKDGGLQSSPMSIAVDDDGSVEPVLVQSKPSQVLCDELARRQSTRRHRVPHLRNRRLDDAEPLADRSRIRLLCRGGDDDEPHDGGGSDDRFHHAVS